jgi:hypothetical protein
MANRGAVWANAEVDQLIYIWREEDIEAQLGGVHRNLPIYQRVAEILNVRGYNHTAS